MDLFSTKWSDFSQNSLRGCLLIQCNEKIFGREVSERNFLVVQKVEKDKDS